MPAKLTVATTKKQAQVMVTRAIIRGELVRPESCEKCGRSKPDAKKAWIEAHHHKGYLAPYTLDVIWLCPSCHKKAHPWSEDGRERHRAAVTGIKRTAESRAKQSASRRRNPAAGWDAERSERQRERMLDIWAVRKGGDA